LFGEAVIDCAVASYGSFITWSTTYLGEFTLDTPP
jgi:hypothetical protein